MSKMLKIVYFDEDAAIDYINITDGGKKIQSTSETSKSEATVGIDAEASIGSKFSLWGLLKFKGEADINSELVKYGKKIVNSTVTTTILTDYLNLANKTNSKVTVFKDCSLYASQESLTFIKMYAPYMKLLKDKMLENISEEFDISKVQEILEDVKGYYEFEVFCKNEKYIFRFNINSFRNNYKISDLLKMKLVFYGIRVGSIKEEKLNVEKEFEIDSPKIPTVDSLLNNEEDKPKEELLTVYDIVLAGVTDE